MEPLPCDLSSLSVTGDRNLESHAEATEEDARPGRAIPYTGLTRASAAAAVPLDPYRLLLDTPVC